VRAGDKKPYVPIFIGSTFTDLEMYRRAVREALEQLEVIIRGMKQFGSKPGSPVEECLRVVASCLSGARTTERGVAHYALGELAGGEPVDVVLSRPTLAEVPGQE
jgi:hypothetical protein